MTLQTKPIRPTEIVFTNDKEISDFKEYASSTEKSNSEGMKELRKKLSLLSEVRI